MQRLRPVKNGGRSAIRFIVFLCREIAVYCRRRGIYLAVMENRALV